MVGLPFFVALAEYLKGVGSLDAGEVVPGSGYPGALFRLKVVFDELSEVDPNLEQRLFEAFTQNAPHKVLGYLAQWREILSQATSNDEGQAPTRLQGSAFALDRALATLAIPRVRTALPKLRELVRKIVPVERCAILPASLPMLVDMLSAGLPPSPQGLGRHRMDIPPSVAFNDVLCAGWVYQIQMGEDREGGHLSNGARHQEYLNTCALLFKALELEISRAVPLQGAELENDTRSAVPGGNRVGVLSGPGILAALRRDAIQDRLSVIPQPASNAVQSASLDVRLGSWFKVARLTHHTSFDIADRDQGETMLKGAQQEVHVRPGDAFVLHPGSFALGVTLEYVSIPGDLMASVEGKSRLGRAGLIIATAAQVAPGFKGCIVLELVNSGTVPLVLRPGMAIAQLVFHTIDPPLSSEWLYRGGFRCQVKP
jgi:dCTP deaminase